ncbi:lipocalin-15 [Oryx dammah]|uniref:lipocalin-15 n=1 Tax=Oryx dammah TaxID=59534 RepID=UPI001A9B19BA|nr:lipocalin-15 [Oryx dammah]
MGATLLSCVLLLLWPPSAQADVLVQPDFDANKFSGLWYVVSMVSDCQVFLGKKDHLLMSTRNIKASAGGNLSVHMEFPRAEGCNQVDAEYLRVGAQGHFRVPALGYLDVRVVDTDYSSFAVVYIYKELEGALSTMVQLYSRTREASPQALEAFQDFYPTVGLPAGMVAMLPKSGGQAHTLRAPETQFGSSQAEFAQGCAGGIGLLQLPMGLNDAAQGPGSVPVSATLGIGSQAIRKVLAAESVTPLQGCGRPEARMHTPEWLEAKLTVVLSGGLRPHPPSILL